MTTHAEDKLSTGVKVISGIVIVVLVGLGATMVKMVLTEDKVRHKAVHNVTLLKPPPPHKLEKLPEPEMKQEKPKENQMVEQQDVQDSKSDKNEPPPGDQLGLDAEGGAGGDAFGLVGRKGGRSLVGSDPNGGGPQSLLQRYAWYNRSISDEIHKVFARGSIPSGNLETVVVLQLDDNGNLVRYRIYKSSGSEQMDSAVTRALGLIKKFSEPPPEGMPKVLRVEISSRA
ncbi:MAG TPA: TonB C-terminal domain-containing protein [Desulfomonilia bacterium]|nr:TonB C-terminal domain-containing protein [Desulfomonilia bacterium]